MNAALREVRISSCVPDGISLAGGSKGALTVGLWRCVVGHQLIRRTRWSVAVAIVVGAGLLVFAPLAGMAVAQPTPTATTQDPRTVELQRRKLEQEVRKLEQDTHKLEIENDRAESLWGLLLAIAPFVTVLIAVGTLGVNFYTQSNNVTQERKELLEQQKGNEEKAEQWRQEFLRQQEKDRAEREQESLRRFDENLARIVTNLGSPTLALQVNAAAALAGFLKPRYVDLHYDLLTVIVANLKLRPDPKVADLLRHDLERAIRLVFDSSQHTREDIGDELDLTRLDLSRINLRKVDFQGVRVDFAFSTLKRADLRECNLDRARGRECEMDGALLSGARLEEARFNSARGQDVQFHRARLVSATFKDAVLPKAQFEQAALQGAHFERADLTAARFEGADLADAYFTGAVFDDSAKRSIALGAERWRAARFDPPIREELTQISESGTRRVTVGAARDHPPE